MKEFDPDTFREEGYKIIDKLAAYLKNIGDGSEYPVLPDTDPDELADYFHSRLISDQDNDIGTILDEFIKYSNHLHSPGYIGHQCTSPLPLSALTHLSAALLNNGSAVYEMGPANTAMEKAVIKNFAPRLGFGKEADGIFTHGGSAGNLTALLAARQAMAGYDIWTEGVHENSIPGFIVSEQSHYSITRNLKIMGLGEASALPIPVDHRFRMRTDLLNDTLSEAHRKGIKVAGVIANACSTATGSYDDLETIGKFCSEHKLWMHVDGAHGSGAIMSRKYRYLLKGIEMADSVVMDFHKMFMIPGLNTLVLFRNGERSYETFAQNASYLFEKTHEKDWYNGAKRTLECTKSSLGLHAYSMLRYYGDEVWEKYIDSRYDLARRFAEIIDLDNNFENITYPESNIVCFRYIDNSSDPDKLNSLIREKLIKAGNFYIVKTDIMGRTWLRVTIINPATKEEDLKKLLEEIKGIRAGIAAVT